MKYILCILCNICMMYHTLYICLSLFLFSPPLLRVLCTIFLRLNFILFFTVIPQQNALTTLWLTPVLSLTLDAAFYASVLMIKFFFCYSIFRGSLLILVYYYHYYYYCYSFGVSLFFIIIISLLLFRF